MGVNGASISNVSRLLIGSTDLLSLGILSGYCKDNNSEFCQAYKEYELYVGLGLLGSSVLTNLPDVYTRMKRGYEQLPASALSGKDKQVLESLFEVNKVGVFVVHGISKADLTASIKGLTPNTKLADDIFELWRTEKWTEMEGLFKLHNLNDLYPPNNGFVESTQTILRRGAIIDRYGGRVGNGVFLDNGTFVSPQNVPFKDRALKLTQDQYLYRRYEVIKDIPNVYEGNAIPWFGQKGGGTQYLLPDEINTLLDYNYIRLLQ